MKKSILALVAALVTTVAAVASTLITKDEVNVKVAALLLPFNTAQSTMELEFTDLDIDATKTLKFGAKAKVWKLGSENELLFVVPSFTYDYGGGLTPTIAGKASLVLDLVKVLGIQEVNELLSGLAELGASLAQSYGEKYENALVISSAMQDLQKDTAGNVQYLKAHFHATIDFAQLPPGLGVEDPDIKEMDVLIEGSPRELTLSLSVVLNPAHWLFAEDQAGLRDYLEALLYDDPTVYDSLNELLQMLDATTSEIVEGAF